MNNKEITYNKDLSPLQLGRVIIDLAGQIQRDKRIKREFLKDKHGFLKNRGLVFPENAELLLYEDEENLVHFVIPHISSEVSNETLNSLVAAGQIHTGSSAGCFGCLSSILCFFDPCLTTLATIGTFATVGSA